MGVGSGQCRCSGERRPTNPQPRDRASDRDQASQRPAAVVRRDAEIKVVALLVDQGDRPQTRHDRS